MGLRRGSLRFRIIGFGFFFRRRFCGKAEVVEKNSDKTQSACGRNDVRKEFFFLKCIFFIFRQIAWVVKEKCFIARSRQKRKKVIFAFVEGNRGQASHEKKIHGGPKSHKPKSKSLSAAETEVFPQKKSSRDFEREKNNDFFVSLSPFHVSGSRVDDDDKKWSGFCGEVGVAADSLFLSCQAAKKSHAVAKKRVSENRSQNWAVLWCWYPAVGVIHPLSTPKTWFPRRKRGGKKGLQQIFFLSKSTPFSFQKEGFWGGHTRDKSTEKNRLGKGWEKEGWVKFPFFGGLFWTNVVWAFIRI